MGRVNRSPTWRHPSMRVTATSRRTESGSPIPATRPAGPRSMCARRQGPGKWQISDGGGWQPLWSGDGEDPVLPQPRGAERGRGRGRGRRVPGGSTRIPLRRDIRRTTRRAGAGLPLFRLRRQRGRQRDLSSFHAVPNRQPVHLNAHVVDGWFEELQAADRGQQQIVKVRFPAVSGHWRSGDDRQQFFAVQGDVQAG